MPSDSDPLRAELAAIDEEVSRAPPAKKAPKILPMFIAFIALASFSGVTWYAYTQGVRTGSEGAAPFLKPAGPAKVPPAEPGGLEVPNQDKLVYNRLNRRGDDKKVERLLPPPESPLPLPKGAVGSAAASPVKEPPLASPKLARPESPPVQTAKFPEPPKPPKSPEEQKKEAKTTEPPKPPQPPAAPAVSAPAPSAPPKAATPPVPPAPAAPTAAVKPPAPPKAPAGQPAAVKPPAPPGKGYRVQIGSMRSQASAERAWKITSGKHKDVLGGLSLHVQRAAVRGRGEFFRVQAGPLKDAAAARQACDTLKRRKVGCIIVRP